ncbi:integral membrane protein [Aspergillus bombycis]|uniref:Integral membrane protein n=1 Tax=Aspergillus bombycis TaxID=109264 RepID=A0A1F8AEV2_9EURO|nr:integral membrane protein [Aspergillus bombycis]OGM50191.1 integral membrane protein [Aspergillus bombycis]
MKLPPADVLATWPTPNYIDPTTRGDSVLIVTIVFAAIAFVVTCLRLYTRFKITCSPGIDDILIVVALAFTVAMCVVICLATERYGCNRHIWDVPLEWLSTASKFNLLFQILFSLSSSITKLALLWFCKRLLGAGSKGLYTTYNIVLIGAMVLVALLCIIFLFVCIFQCSPIHAYWDFQPTYPHHCLNDGAVVFAASVVNIFTDFLSTVIPMPLIWNLKLPARQRIAVMSIFSLGIVVNVAGTVRTVYVYKSMIASYDMTWFGWPVFLAASIEINLGLICASAPALRPLVAFFLPRLLQSTQRYASGYGQSRPQKLWSSVNPSRHSTRPSRGRSHHHHTDSQLERFEVYRTVEMETWTESRNPSEPTDNTHSMPANHARVTTPNHDFDLKYNTAVYTSPGSEKSSASLTRQTSSPFKDKHSI